MHADEAGPFDEVGAADRCRIEAEMADGHRAGLLRVVHEVRLRVEVGVLADDLGGVLVRADGAVGAEPVEHGADLRMVGDEGRVMGQAAVRHVVDDAHREPVARGVSGCLCKHRGGHRRGELLAAQPVAAANHPRGDTACPGVGGAVPQRRQHVEVQRFERCPRFLRAVEHRDGPHARWQRCQQRSGGERAVEAHDGDADSLAAPVQLVDRLGDGTDTGTHQHDHPIRVGRTVVVDEVVRPAGHRRQAIERRLHRGRHPVVEGVARLAGLEEHVGVLRTAAQHRSVGIEAAVAVIADRLRIDQRGQLVGGRHFDRVNLVARAEPVEEVQEGHAGVERGGVRDRGEVRCLLHAAGAQHRETRGAGGHHVAVVTEDAQRMGGDGARGDMDHRRGQLTGDLEHVGEHQQQALAGGERRRHGAPRDRAVQCASRTGLALHLDHLWHGAPQVGATLRTPVVGELTHRRRRRDRIDRNHLTGEMGDARGGLVGIDDSAGVMARFGRGADLRSRVVSVHRQPPYGSPDFADRGLGHDVFVGDGDALPARNAGSTSMAMDSNVASWRASRG